MKLSDLKGGEQNVLLRKARRTPGADSLTMQCNPTAEIRLAQVAIVEGYDRVRYIRLGRGDLMPIYRNSDWDWEWDSDVASPNRDRKGIHEKSKPYI